MKLQKNSRLALLSVLECAAAGERQVAAFEIADKYGVSAHHLAKVLADLARAGIVESVRGAGGGYRFAANARRLTLHDVIGRFEELTPADARRRERGDTTPAGRALAAVLSEIDQIAIATFRSITIATMLAIMARQVVPRASEPASSRRVGVGSDPATPRRSRRQDGA